MNNLILSLSVEARMIIAEIIALIGLTIIIAIYSNNKIKHLNDKTFYLYDVKNTHTAKIKLSLLPILVFIISLILISVQIAFSWDNLLAKNETINSSQTIASTSQQEVQNQAQIAKSETNTTPTTINNNTSTTNTTETQSKTTETKPNENKTTENKTQTNKISENKTTESKTTTTNEKSIAYLTFDDGPSSNITPKVLDVLKEEGVKATFFVLGQNVKSHPEQLKRIYDEGHYIANHSYTHKYSKIYASVDALLEEFNDTEAEIKKVVGEGYNTFLFRFPGGSYGGVYNKIKKQIKGILRDKGIVSLDWNALSGDAEGKKTVDAQLKKFEDSRKGETGLVVLMHDIGDKHATPETARQIIKRLKAEGYVFKNFYEIFQ